MDLTDNGTTNGTNRREYELGFMTTRGVVRRSCCNPMGRLEQPTLLVRSGSCGGELVDPDHQTGSD